MVSNSDNPWDVDTATCAVISCALPVTWIKFDSSKYSKLSVGEVLKKIVSPPFSVDNPTKSFDILFANTVDPSVRLKLAVTDWVTPVPTDNAPAPDGILNVNYVRFISNLYIV